MNDDDRLRVIEQMVDQMDGATSTEWNIYQQSGKFSKKIVIEYQTEVKTWK
jgi:hypothetical protein